MVERKSPTLVVIRLTDEPDVKHQIEAIEGIEPIGDAVLDFALVSFLSSIHLAQLLTLRRHLHGHDRQLRLCNMRPNVRELFKITSLELVLEITENEEDAVASLGKE